MSAPKRVEEPQNLKLAVEGHEQEFGGERQREEHEPKQGQSCAQRVRGPQSDDELPQHREPARHPRHQQRPPQPRVTAERGKVLQTPAPGRQRRVKDGLGGQKGRVDEPQDGQEHEKAENSRDSPSKCETPEH